MDGIDPKIAAEVWQRVQGEAPIPKSRNSQAMLLREHTLFGAYTRLARQLPEYGGLLSRMAEQTRQDMACLRGVGILNEKPMGILPTVKPVLEPPELTLKKCYANVLQMTAAYDDMSADREYGCVYEFLASRKREHCCKILQLLGSLK